VFTQLQSKWSIKAKEGQIFAISSEAEMLLLDIKTSGLWTARRTAADHWALEPLILDTEFLY
jgi:hypothetical protein